MAKIEFTKEMALKMGRHEAMEQHCLVRYVKACREFGIPQKDFAVGHKCPMCGNLCAGSDAELKNRENAGLCDDCREFAETPLKNMLAETTHVSIHNAGEFMCKEGAEFLEKEAKEVAAYNEKITAKKEDFDARLSKYLNENFYGGYVTVGTKVFKV